MAEIYRMHLSADLCVMPRRSTLYWTQFHWQSKAPMGWLITVGTSILQQIMVNCVPGRFFAAKKSDVIKVGEVAFSYPSSAMDVAVGLWDISCLVGLPLWLRVKYLKTVGWIVIKLSTDIHVSLRIRPSDFGDPLTFNLPSPLCQHLLLGLWWITCNTNGIPIHWTKGVNIIAVKNQHVSIAKHHCAKVQLHGAASMAIDF